MNGTLVLVSQLSMIPPFCFGFGFAIRRNGVLVLALVFLDMYVWIVIFFIQCYLEKAIFGRSVFVCINEIWTINCVKPVFTLVLEISIKQINVDSCKKIKHHILLLLGFPR